MTKFKGEKAKRCYTGYKHNMRGQIVLYELLTSIYYVYTPSETPNKKPKMKC